MPEGQEWSIAGLDADTPVLLLGNLRLHDRSAVVLFSDDDRMTLLRVVAIARERGEAIKLRDEHRRFTDRTIVRVGAVAALLVGVSDLITNFVVIASHSH